MADIFNIANAILILKAAGVLLLGTIVALLFKGIDRKIVARLQARYGPPIIQPFYDIKKLMTKQTIVPKNAVSWVFNWAPVIALASSLALLLFIPMGLSSVIDGDLIVVWYILLFPSVALAIGGFASGSPYSVIGAQREIVIMASYEMPLAIAVLGIAYVLNIFSLNYIYANPVWGSVGVLGTIGFLILFAVMLIGIAPELSKLPFDIPEAETEIAGGVLAEYSGRNLGFFYIADAVKAFALAALVIALFFPYTFSWILPTQETTLLVIWNIFVFLVEVFVLMFFSVMLVRSAFARLRIEQASRFLLGWLLLVSLVGLLFVLLDKVLTTSLVGVGL